MSQDILISPDPDCPDWIVHLPDGRRVEFSSLRSAIAFCTRHDFTPIIKRIPLTKHRRNTLETTRP